MINEINNPPAVGVENDAVHFVHHILPELTHPKFLDVHELGRH